MMMKNLSFQHISHIYYSFLANGDLHRPTAVYFSMSDYDRKVLGALFRQTKRQRQAS